MPLSTEQIQENNTKYQQGLVKMGTGSLIKELCALVAREDHCHYVIRPHRILACEIELNMRFLASDRRYQEDMRKIKNTDLKARES